MTKASAVVLWQRHCRCARLNPAQFAAQFLLVLGQVSPVRRRGFQVIQSGKSYGGIMRVRVMVIRTLRSKSNGKE